MFKLEVEHQVQELVCAQLQWVQALAQAPASEVVPDPSIGDPLEESDDGCVGRIPYTSSSQFMISTACSLSIGSILSLVILSMRRFADSGTQTRLKNSSKLAITLSCLKLPPMRANSCTAGRDRAGTQSNLPSGPSARVK